MEDLLLSTLGRLGYPVFRQGSFSKKDKYPEHFFTFWNNSSADGAHYDNGAVSCIWDFDVNFYSTDPALAYGALEKARQALKENGFIISGKGYDVGSDEATHTGRGMNALFLEMEG
ncbi:MAG: hypothetical protein HFE61_08500 [Anaerotignum sp.]|jgi:hypothetical protein|nr:hypothetical protein [Anaerotignum sp.]